MPPVPSLTPLFLSPQDTQKAKQFLPFLQRAGRSEAVVEYVFSGSRLKLFMPKETCLITFLLAGEPPPQDLAPRRRPGGLGGVLTPRRGAGGSPLTPVGLRVKLTPVLPMG